jgi:prepilin-type N-terminal cleavage/methylation domain-containing protein
MNLSLAFRHKNSGFTLIELIIFIVIIGMAAVALTVPLTTATQKLPTANHQTIAVALAQERMELILARRWLATYATFTDPCAGGSPPGICTLPAGYTATANIAATTLSGDSGYKTITVTISGAGDAALTTLVGNY